MDRAGVCAEPGKFHRLLRAWNSPRRTKRVFGCIFRTPHTLGLRTQLRMFRVESSLVRLMLGPRVVIGKILESLLSRSASWEEVLPCGSEASPEQAAGSIYSVWPVAVTSSVATPSACGLA